MEGRSRFFQRNLGSKKNYSKILIWKEERRKHYNQNHTSPRIKGLLKLHKPNNPIRPIVNWWNAPAYKVAKFLVNILKSYAALPYAVNVKNMKQLLLDIQQIPFDEELKFASFNITNMYTNVPNKKVRGIIHDILIKNGVDQRIKKEVLDICDVIIQMNYYFFLWKILYTQGWLSHGGTHIYHIGIVHPTHWTHCFLTNPKKCRILGCFGYVNNILSTNIESKVSLPHIIRVLPSMFQISTETCSWLTYYFYKVVFDGC